MWEIFNTHSRCFGTITYFYYEVMTLCKDEMRKMQNVRSGENEKSWKKPEKSRKKPEKNERNEQKSRNAEKMHKKMHKKKCTNEKMKKIGKNAQQIWFIFATKPFSRRKMISSGNLECNPNELNMRKSQVFGVKFRLKAERLRFWVNMLDWSAS